MEYDSAFLIRSPKHIANKLAILRKNKCLLSVAFGDKGDSFITTILEISNMDNSLIFRYGPPKNLLETLHNSDNITFKTEHLGIKVSFNGRNMMEIRHNGVSAFATPLPDDLLWLESREYYRVKIPSLKPSFCLLMPNSEKPIKLRLYDISLTGFSVLNDSVEISRIMNPNIHFKNCKLLLPDIMEEAVSFEIRHRHLIRQEHIKRTEKIGCKFTVTTPAFENIIQCYMLEIERQYRQKLSTEYEGLFLHGAAGEKFP